MIITTLLVLGAVSYCCRKAPCGVATRVFGNGISECPALRYDEEKKRYFCELCEKPGEIGHRYRQELYIGAGCCSPLFNQDRENIPPPRPKNDPLNHPHIDKQLRAFFHAMGRQGPFGFSGDAVWLLVHAAAKELGKGEDWIQACFAAIKEERSKETDEFMGEIENYQKRE